jgi:HlyD family secretion protein
LDVSAIFKGQPVRFTLEALPGRTYTGVVKNRYMVPTVQDGVVSYTVIINVENQDGSLLPGMTCGVEFIQERNENILLVPNAALRYQPSSQSQPVQASQTGQAGQTQGLAGLLGSGGGTGGGGPGSGRSSRSQPMESGSRRSSGGVNSITIKSLWFINDEGKPEMMMVKTGISDGSFTEIIDGHPEGTRIILREKV